MVLNNCYCFCYLKIKQIIGKPTNEPKAITYKKTNGADLSQAGTIEK